MIIKDIRKDFFDLLQHERILVVANLDVDSVCAVKILQSLLQCDNVQYTLVPVVGKSDLIRAFEVKLTLSILYYKFWFAKFQKFSNNVMYGFKIVMDKEIYWFSVKRTG